MNKIYRVIITFPTNGRPAYFVTVYRRHSCKEYRPHDINCVIAALDKLMPNSDTFMNQFCQQITYTR